MTGIATRPATTLGRAPSIPATQIMNAGDADVVEMLGAVAHHAGGEERFLGHGNVAGPGRNYQD